MSELRKANTDHTYFVTLTVVGWIDLFTRYQINDIVVTNLNYCIENKGLKIYAFVIMPSHIHLVARQVEGKLNEVLRDFKSYSAKQIIKSIEEGNWESRRGWLLYMFRYYASKTKQNSKYQLWQKTNYPIELLDGKMVEEKINYIHKNPVEAQLVDEQSSYVYSSANELCEVVLEEC